MKAEKIYLGFGVLLTGYYWAIEIGLLVILLFDPPDHIHLGAAKHEV